MKKLLSLLTIMAIALPMLAEGSASDAYFNVALHATIDEAGATVDGMESIYHYAPQGTGYWLTVSNYGVMKTDDTQNWFTNEVTDGDTGSQYTNAWTATDIFPGPSAYFGDGPAYSAKYKMPAKSQTFYVTFCEQVKQYAYHRSNASYYAFKMEIYECTLNGDGTVTAGNTPIQTLNNSVVGTEVLTSQELDPEKIYKVVLTNSYSYLYEIGFKTPGLYDGPIIAPVAYEATNVQEQHVTMHWSPSPGARSYTLRTYPATFDGLIFREKFSNFTDGLALSDYQSLDAYTDHPEWMGYSISGADGGVVIENNGSLSTPYSQENCPKIPPYQKEYTLKFKAKPAEGVTSGELLVSSGAYNQRFDISGPEKYYTFVIRRGLDGSLDYMSGTFGSYIFKNTYYYNPNDGGEEEDHRVVITDLKLYLGDYSDPEEGSSAKWWIPAWSGDTTFVKNIADTVMVCGTAPDEMAHYNGIAYWIYEVKSVYYGGQESEWSNKIYYSTEPWPVILEDDDDDPIEEPVVGDVNGDGEVNTVDITILYNYILNGDTENMVHGDQDDDGEITTVDITVVYNVLLGV